MSNSSLSENISINNDTDTPPNPLTPPPSPLSPNEKPIARAEVTETQPLNEDKPLENDSSMNDQNDSQTTAQGEQIVWTFILFSPFLHICKIPNFALLGE